MRVSQAAARLIAVAAQGLHRRSEAPADKAAVRTMIRRMHALQIDTIHVVARSPYFVLWSRLGDYQPCWLDELLAEGALFEYWAHEACFLPIEDYPLYRHRMIAPGALGWKYSHSWIAEHQAEVQQVLTAIRERGALRSADFVRTDGRSGGWWEWKPEKRALEMLFTAGELMIARRHHFQRVYDLRERVLPTWDDAQVPSREEVHRTLVLNAVQALGITTARWVADYFRTKQRETIELPEKLAEAGALIRVAVEGWSESAYVHPQMWALAEAAGAGAMDASLTTLLSPFDPLVWDRARVRTMFGFDYTIECYTPAPKRRYGYFTLPILNRGELIGRLDAKAHRKDGLFEVKALHLEPDTPLSDVCVSDLTSALRECARWHGTPDIAVRWSAPTELAGLLERALGSV